jgi:diphthamide biosynthesis methyltransferase
MLYLLGTGIYDTFETSDSIEILKNCDRVYVEKFTSPLSGNFIKILKSAIGPEKKNRICKKVVCRRWKTIIGRIEDFKCWIDKLWRSGHSNNLHGIENKGDKK